MCRTSKDEREYIACSEDVADACQETIELRKDEDAVIHRERRDESRDGLKLGAGVD